jgi:hypothetical protein
MSRKIFCSVIAGWLAVASVGLAQPRPGGGGRRLSPYYPTASTVDHRGGEESELPEMPNVPVPRAGVPGRPASMMSSPPLPPAPSAGLIAPAPNNVPAPPAGSMSNGPTMAAPMPGGTVVEAPMSGAPTMVSPPPGAPVVGAPAGGAYGPEAYGAAPWAGCGSDAGCGRGPGGPCGPDGRLWLSTEYLLWWTQGMSTPPLVTASPAGTPRAAAGVLGDARTVVLFGDERVNNDIRSGFRVRAGFWLDECNLCGLEGSYLFLGRRCEDDVFVGFPGTPILARPFFNAAPGAPGTTPVAGMVGVPAADAELVNFPGVVAGSVAAEACNEFYGYEANLRKNLGCDCNYRIDFLAGYRFLRLEDSVVVTENLVATDPAGAVPAGTRFILQDRFDTRNDFHGGQVGLAGEVRQGRAFVSLRALVALGNVYKQTWIGGATLIGVPGQAEQTNAGGLLAQPTNIGAYSRNDFAVVPEGTVSVGYQLTDGIRAFVGYTFLYWSNVWRAGDQIDLVVNPTQIAPGTLFGVPRPIFPGKDDDFWAQGVNFGLEFRY